MFPSFKYYEKIEEAQRAHTPKGPGATPEIDFDQPPEGFFTRIGNRVVGWLLQGAFWFFRTFWPNPRFGRLVIVTRAKDVRAALENPAFQVPFKPEMKELGGADSILGLEGCPHKTIRDVIQEAFRPEDEKRVAEDAGAMAKALICNAQGRLDVIGDLITRCASETCARYYGLTVDDPVAFADWTMAVSQVLFADPFGNPEVRRRALYASARLRELARRGIAEAKVRRRIAPVSAGDKTIIERLVEAQAQVQAKGKTISDEELCANLVGLVTAYVPTAPLAGGKMLQVLMKRPKVWQAACSAARDDDREGLKAILWEASRLNPGLNPGQWRYARMDGVIAEGTWRQRRVPEDSILLVATASALRDPQAFAAPLAFDARRDQDPDLMFGAGAHWCLGKGVAMALLTEVLMQLLAQGNLRRAGGRKGRMRWGGPYPRQLDMKFTPPQGATQSGQSMIAVCAPLSHNANLGTVRGQVEALCKTSSNTVHDRLWRALRKTGRIHFLSLSLVDLGTEKKDWRLLLEVNADGPADEALCLLARAANRWLEPIFAHVPDGEGALLETLKRYNIASHAKPWSMTHLNFNGVEEFSVADIARQRALGDFTRRAVDWYMKDNASRGLPPILVLRFVRRLIQGGIGRRRRQSPVDLELDQLAKDGRQFRDFVIQPTRRQLKLADWQPVTNSEVALRIAASPELRPVWKAVGVLWLGLVVLYFAAANPWSWSLKGADYLILGRWTWRLPWTQLPASTWQTGGAILHFVVIGLLSAALLVGLLGAATVLVLRLKEQGDAPDTRYPTLADIEARTRHENAPGYASNHFISTPTLKKGLFRRLTLAAAFLGIRTVILYAFRPGFVSSMGTIHYAKWFRPPNSRRLVFLADYDGSWESYLEDFIMKAHPGQTAGWSNCEGFPPTRFLVLDGAQDGDRFKRWVRLQQVPTACWFSCFPDLTTERIRTNALVHYGIARAHNDSDARAWLACLGSQQRPEPKLETDEIQSLVFSGFKDLPYGLCAVFRLPDDLTKARKVWLPRLVGELEPTSMRWIDPPAETAVSFGDVRPWNDKRPPSATIVAFSRSGLARLGLPTGKNGDGLGTFPGAFVTGMSRRSAILGDEGGAASDSWRWGDRQKGQAPASDGVLMIYAESHAECRRLLRLHARAIGGRQPFFEVILTQPAFGKELDREPFGFRDGLSQPLIRGTQRFVATDSAADAVEPGEFILGYRSNQGYFPTTPIVNADTDGLGLLATSQAESPSPYPAFAEDQQEIMFHDFGRNGAYLVLRQLEQDVAGFEAFTQRAAARLEATYRGLSTVIGSPITAEWVAAKLVGRWRDGTPLVDRPSETPNAARAPKSAKYANQMKDIPDNSFTYGADDPQGVRCPLGAHIRRANPRDSLQPGDPSDRAIVNRHRLLRRGRPYVVGDGKDIMERGLLFACICSDLERQFELVQQTWINSLSFHGLNAEADPLLGGGGGGFTIPTSAGPVRVNDLQRFVTPRGGGYYFMPSRSALAYLAARE